MSNNADDIITLTGKDGQDIDFVEIAGISYKGSFYAILQPVELIDGMNDDEALVFKVTQDSNGEDSFDLELDDQIIDAVFKEYDKLFDEAQKNQAKSSKASSNKSSSKTRRSSSASKKIDPKVKKIIGISALALGVILFVLGLILGPKVSLIIIGILFLLGGGATLVENRKKK